MNGIKFNFLPSLYSIPINRLLKIVLPNTTFQTRQKIVYENQELLKIKFYTMITSKYYVVRYVPRNCTVCNRTRDNTNKHFIFFLETTRYYSKSPQLYNYVLCTT